ncbi:unnamed protein product [Ectocarpus sp. CCAP 1310/34]|nr:unnamed protein product [Ectocarpus sp. CCAP 1310/34]
MAIGSEVHVLARTQQQQQQPGNASRHCGRRGEGGRQAGAGETVEAGDKSGNPGMTVFASLHRKLIVQQVLTEAKRAEIKARNDEIDRREKQAKKKMARMEDQEEMLAAAEAIPVPVGQAPPPPPPPPPPQEGLQQQSVGGTGTARREVEVKAAVGSGGERRRRRRPRRRDPLTAWVCGCYNDDGYAGHVSDLRQFFRGIDFHHLMLRYHVLPDGTLDPDRRRFCVRFKTKAGRDLAIKRSGEALGSYCSWWDPGDVVTVIRGRDVASDSDGGGIDDMLVVLPQGRSVADVLDKVEARLPKDLTPALAAQRTDDDATNNSKKRPRRHRKHDDGERPQQLPESQLEAYRRDMLRAALGCGLAEALALGPKRGAPAAAARVAGTDEDNARRVAILASGEAATALDRGTAAAAREGRRSSGSGGGVQVVPSGPVGGARAQCRRRRRLLLEEEGESPVARAVEQ